MYVSRTPPNATVTAGPPQRRAVPASVTFALATEPATPAGAPVAYAQCLLRPLGQARTGARCPHAGTVKALLMRFIPRALTKCCDGARDGATRAARHSRILPLPCA